MSWRVKPAKVILTNYQETATSELSPLSFTYGESQASQHSWYLLTTNPPSTEHYHATASVQPAKVTPNQLPRNCHQRTFPTKFHVRGELGQPTLPIPPHNQLALPPITIMPPRVSGQPKSPPPANLPPTKFHVRGELGQPTLPIPPHNQLALPPITIMPPRVSGQPKSPPPANLPPTKFHVRGELGQPTLLIPPHD